MRLIAEWLGKQPIQFRLSWQYCDSLQKLLVHNAWLSNSFDDVPCYRGSIDPTFKVDGHLYTVSCFWAQSDPVMQPMLPLLHTGGLKHIPTTGVSLETNQGL
jgi:hypothetical protein